MFLLWTALLVLAAITAILLVPVVLRVDTAHARYELHWGPMHVQLLFTGAAPSYRFTAPFVRKEGPLFVKAISRPAVRSVPHARAPEHDGTRAGARYIRRLPVLLRSFHVRRFSWTLDTGDAVLNAWLFPLAQRARHAGYDARVSFTGTNDLQLVLGNNLYRMLMAVLFTSKDQPTHKRHEGHG